MCLLLAVPGVWSFLRVTRRKQHRPGIAPNANTTLSPCNTLLSEKVWLGQSWALVLQVQISLKHQPLSIMYIYWWKH